MKKYFTLLFMLILNLMVMAPSIAEEGESYTTEDFMVDPKINSGEKGKIKRQVGEAGYESISSDHVIAGDRFDDSSDAETPGIVETPSASEGASR